MKNCSKCKYCYSDYFYDDAIGDEIQFDYCSKNHSVALDDDCNDFEEFKQTPYVEKDTECDICEHLSNCKESGIFIETTTIHDITRHFVCDKSKCLKNELPWVTVGMEDDCK